jgi:hypothetical protein
VFLTKYYSGDQIQKTGMNEACTVARMLGRRGVYSVMVGKLEGGTIWKTQA